MGPLAFVSGTYASTPSHHHRDSELSSEPASGRYAHLRPCSSTCARPPWFDQPVDRGPPGTAPGARARRLGRRPRRRARAPGQGPARPAAAARGAARRRARRRARRPAGQPRRLERAAPDARRGPPASCPAAAECFACRRPRVSNSAWLPAAARACFGCLLWESEISIPRDRALPQLRTRFLARLDLPAAYGNPASSAPMLPNQLSRAQDTIEDGGRRELETARSCLGRRLECS